MSALSLLLSVLSCPMLASRLDLPTSPSPSWCYKSRDHGAAVALGILSAIVILVVSVPAALLYRRLGLTSPLVFERASASYDTMHMAHGRGALFLILLKQWLIVTLVIMKSSRVATPPLAVSNIALLVAAFGMHILHCPFLNNHENHKLAANLLAAAAAGASYIYHSGILNDEKNGALADNASFSSEYVVSTATAMLVAYVVGFGLATVRLQYMSWVVMIQKKDVTTVEDLEALSVYLDQQMHALFGSHGAGRHRGR
jgi:hypothetical protein